MHSTEMHSAKNAQCKNACVDEFFGGGARDHRVYVTTHHDFDARPEPQMPQWYVLKCAE